MALDSANPALEWAGSQPRKHLLLNAAGFQLAWFACVLGGNAWALAVVPLFLLMHYTVISRDRLEWQGIAAVAVAGMVMDFCWQSLGLLNFHGAGLPLPLWLMLLWPAFASTLNHSLRTLWSRPLLAAVLGAISGPLSYLAGVRFGAAGSDYPLWLLGLWMAPAWGLFFPLALRLTVRRLEEEEVQQ